MGFGEAISSCLSHYASFRGRASRSEYWFFNLFFIICAVVASIIDRLLGTAFTMHNPMTGAVQSLGYGYVYAVVALGLFLPLLTATVRRLHDTNRSGWWYFIALVPLIGAILLLVWYCSKGTDGGNDYGSDPLGGGYGDTFS